MKNDRDRKKVRKTMKQIRCEQVELRDKYVLALMKEGYSDKEIIKELSEELHLNYKEGTIKHLKRCARSYCYHQEQFIKDNEYMEKCRKELDLQKEKDESVEYAEQLFRLARGLEE